MQITFIFPFFERKDRIQCVYYCENKSLKPQYQVKIYPYQNMMEMTTVPI